MKKGLVIKSTGSHYTVITQDNSVISCTVKGRFRVHGIKTTNPVAVGDIVGYDEAEDNKGVIREIEERKNYIIRKSPKLSKETQIIAANIDQALLMISLKEPVTPEEFIDRFLVAAESFRIPVILFFNKTDIYGEAELGKMSHLAGVYESIGYRCFTGSLLKGSYPALIKEMLAGKTTLVSGNSGVGKSTLLNSIVPGLNIKTEDISAYHKQGKHTTTFAEMYTLPGGGFIIDTPGIKGFGITDLVREEIYHFFPEIFKASHSCHYHNCLHDDEPGCAVIDAVENGKIEWSRYRSYINILQDPNSKYRV